MQKAADFETNPGIRSWVFPRDGFEWVGGRDCPLPGVYGPFLIAKGAGGPIELHRYRLQRSPAVLDEFLALADEPSADKILEFANHRGWLGRPVATYPAARPPTPPTSPLTYESRTLFGEPMGLWRRELAKMRDLEMVRSRLERCEVKSVDAERSRWFLKDRLPEIEGGFVFRYGGPVPVDDEVAAIHGGGRGREAGEFQVDLLSVPRDAVDRGKLGDIASVARAALELALEKELRTYTHVHVSADHKRIEWAHAGLLTALHFHLLQNLVVGSSGLRRSRICLRPGCGVSFAYKSRSAKYCSARCREKDGYYRRLGRALGEPR